MKTEISPAVKVNIYKLINDCVERGIEAGWNKAHKHTDKPDSFLIKEEIEKYIMLEFSDNFIFNEI